MAAVDTERFRLRRFVERLVQLGECEVHDKPIDLVDVAGVLEGNPRATWFKAVGPEKAELIGNVMGSRRRLALALDTDEAGLLPAIADRLGKPVKPLKVASADAPVQQVVVKGEEADLCSLPVHLQHGEDGAPYISAGLDVMVFRETGHTNIGCRRIMLRGPRAAGIDMIAPSDARAIYLDAVSRGERLPVAYVVGSTPCDFMAAVCMNPPMDELEVLGALRGAPVPIVKCVTNDIWVPADAEYVLEGYLDDKGHAEPEGPFGEYVGYYGVVKKNPVFHLTAITHRKDALFQTVTIGGKHLGRTDTAQLTTVKTESAAWAGLVTSVREPVAVFATPSSAATRPRAVRPTTGCASGQATRQCCWCSTGELRTHAECRHFAPSPYVRYRTLDGAERRADRRSASAAATSPPDAFPLRASNRHSECRRVARF
jgi:UbiD family decarboxylase